MTPNKKQHFIPSSYLLAWADPDCPSGQDPYVWRFDVDGTNGRRKSPEKLFHEPDMYTITKPDGQRDLRLEQGLSKIERNFVKARKKLAGREDLTNQDRVALHLFVAAAHARTPATREHWREQWKEPLAMMDELAASMKTKTTAEKMAAASKQLPASGPTMDHDQVRRLVEKPMQSLLVPLMNEVARWLVRLDLLVCETTDPVGFITSDHPCIWFDAEAHKRPAMFRSPAIMYDSIEITMPISPSCLFVYNRRGLKGFHKTERRLLDEMNRRQRFHARESFVVRSNYTDPFWFKAR